MAAVQGYCVKCKDKRAIVNSEKFTMKNGRPAVRGQCLTCGGKMNAIVKSE